MEPEEWDLTDIDTVIYGSVGSTKDQHKLLKRGQGLFYAVRVYFQNLPSVQGDDPGLQGSQRKEGRSCTKFNKLKSVLGQKEMIRGHSCQVTIKLSAVFSSKLSTTGVFPEDQRGQRKDGNFAPSTGPFLEIQHKNSASYLSSV